MRFRSKEKAGFLRIGKEIIEFDNYELELNEIQAGLMGDNTNFTCIEEPKKEIKPKDKSK